MNIAIAEAFRLGSAHDKYGRHNTLFPCTKHGTLPLKKPDKNRHKKSKAALAQYKDLQ